jgi:integrase
LPVTQSPLSLLPLSFLTTSERSPHEVVNRKERGSVFDDIWRLIQHPGFLETTNRQLQWPDVDLKGRAINVQHTLIEINGKLSLAEPKTPKSRRRVDLPRVVVDALTKHRAQSVREGFAKQPWVFCNSTGGPLRRTHFHVNHFKPMLATAGLPVIRFHDLRHTSATLLLAAGVHPKVVQERLGHSQIGITLDTYSHVVPTMQLEAASKLDTLMRSSAKPAKSRRRA